MKYLSTIIIFILAAACSTRTQRVGNNVLLYSTAENWSDPAFISLFELLKAQTDAVGIQLDTTQSDSKIEEEQLKRYGAVVLLGIDVDLLPVRQHVDIERFVGSGGGLVAVNTDTTHHLYWPWIHDQIQTGTNPQVQFLQFDTPPADFGKTLQVAMGDNSYDFTNVTQPRAPDPDRFIKDVLDNNINEPMKLAVLPDGRVLFIERRGEIKLYEPEKRETRIIDKFDVRLDGNYEDGMLGLALDPEFEINNWVYIYYSPANTAIQSLSRFTLYGGDSLARDSEKVVLEVPVQIETCCHSGGDVVFGPDGLLYLSTGDNTSSKESNGYSPLDERPGRAPFDAQKGSSNTNDLRGKIIRIKPEDDGTYSIPDGNLFAKDGSEGLPEIYLMGLRNPFRFTIHPKNSHVYWGEVGPDAGSDGKYGPRSYDEFNRASAPGFFGWPYFQGNNIAYPSRDFENDEVGELFNPAAPVNNSPNNTGARELPPAQESLIWYPYATYDKFPMLGAGSRSAMGGPFYFTDMYPESNVKLPDYYNGKWFIYEWARSWVKVVSFDENDQMIKIEPFYAQNQFHKPIDFGFGPDGSIYMLEYGANYFANNSDAALIRIRYAGGNLQPVPVIAATNSVGPAPLSVEFNGEGSSDPDPDDELTFTWDFGNGEQSSEVNPTYTYTEPGIYKATLTVSDVAGERVTAQTEIKVGNGSPEVSIDFGGNRSFYFNNQEISYAVTVEDHEDGRSGSDISDADVYVMFQYLSEGKDLALLNPGAMFGASGKYAKGKALIETSDCATCHAIDQTSIGPTYNAIAGKYQRGDRVIDTLASKIIEGGTGVWGHNIMAAHPQHTMEEARSMVEYILSLSETTMEGANLPLTGTVRTDQHVSTDDGLYLLGASYTDQGGEVVGPITTQAFITLSSPVLRTHAFDFHRDAIQRREVQNNDLSYVTFAAPGAYVGYKDVDLNQIRTATFRLRSNTDFTLSMRAGSPEGEEILSKSVSNTDREWVDVSNPLMKSVFGDVFITVTWPESEQTQVDFEYVRFSN